MAAGGITPKPPPPLIIPNSNSTASYWTSESEYDNEEDVLVYSGAKPIVYAKNVAMSFKTEDITSSGWVDSISGTSMTLSGNYTLTPGTFLQINGQHRCSVPVANSSFFAFIKFTVDPSFSPINSGNWYSSSCVIGRELSSAQKDFGAIINSSGYLCFGYQFSSITPTNAYVKDGAEHALKLAWKNRVIYMECDDVYLGSVSGGNSNGEIRQLGIMWNGNDNPTYVKGTVTELKIGYT